MLSLYEPFSDLSFIMFKLVQHREYIKLENNFVFVHDPAVSVQTYTKSVITGSFQLLYMY